MLTNREVIAFFPIHGQFAAIGKLPDAWSIKLIFSLTITFHLTKTANITKSGESWY